MGQPWAEMDQLLRTKEVVRLFERSSFCTQKISGQFAVGVDDPTFAAITLYPRFIGGLIPTKRYVVHMTGAYYMHIIPSL
jgi:hypothetical protein